MFSRGICTLRALRLRSACRVRANADVRFSSLSYGFDEAVPAEILRGTALKPEQSGAFHDYSSCSQLNRFVWMQAIY